MVIGQIFLWRNMKWHSDSGEPDKSHILLKHHPPTSPKEFEHALKSFEKLCNVQERLLSRCLAKCYILLLARVEKQPLSFVEGWEKELTKTFSIGEWDKILNLTWWTSMSNKYQELHFKILSRWHRTPQTLKRVNPDASELCWRCRGARGNMLLIFWTCLKLTSFWSFVHEVTHKFTNLSLDSSPKFYLLQHKLFFN